MAHRKAAPALGRAGRFLRSGAASRHCGNRRLQPRRQRGRRLFRSQPEKRLALEYRQGLFTPDLPGPAEFRTLDARPGVPAADPAPARRQPALHRRRSVDRPGARHGAGHPGLGTHGRGAAVRRQHRLTADFAALGHRSGRLAAAAWHCCGARPARRRCQPAGPPADPLGLQDSASGGRQALGPVTQHHG